MAKDDELSEYDRKLAESFLANVDKHDEKELFIMNKNSDLMSQDYTSKEEKQLSEAIAAAKRKSYNKSDEIIKAVKFMNDEVNHPSHYQGTNGIECIDTIRAALTPEQFIGFLRGTAMRYSFRFDKKDGDAVKSIAKSIWYHNYLSDVLNGNK